MSRWRGDKRENKRRLSLWETIGDAYLIAVENVERTRVCELPKGPKDLPLPRLVGWTESGTAVAWIPASFIERLLKKKRGFSEAEQYLQLQGKMFLEDATGLIYVVWDPSGLVPSERMGQLRDRLSAPLKHITEDQMAEVYQVLKTYASDSGVTQENWFLDAWRWIEQSAPTKTS